MLQRRENETPRLIRSEQPSRQTDTEMGLFLLSFLPESQLPLLPASVQLPTMDHMAPRPHEARKHDAFTTRRPLPENDGIAWLKIQETINELHPHHQEVLRDYLQSLKPEEKRDHIDRLRTLLTVAEKTFAPAAREYARQPSQENLIKLEQELFSWFALICPYIGEKTPWILGVEQKTGMQNVNTERVWTSQESRKTYISREDLEKPENTRLAQDASMWTRSGGLPIHTAAAAWSIQRFTNMLKENIHEFAQNGEPINDHQKVILSLDTNIMRVWLLFHDIMRSLTHNTFVHAAALPLFGKLLNLPPDLYKDYDLPELLAYQKPNPAEYNDGLGDLQIDDSEYANPRAVLEKGVNYVNRALQFLDRRYKENFPAESIAIFWIMDAYSKMQNVPTEKNADQLEEGSHIHTILPGIHTHLENLDRQESRIIADLLEAPETVKSAQARIEELDRIRKALEGVYEDREIMLSGRSIADTGPLFLGRFNYRDTLGSRDISAMYWYYSRQSTLAYSMWNWFREELGIDKEDLWKFFFEQDAMQKRLLDEDGNFQYHFTDATGHLEGYDWQNSSLKHHRKNKGPRITIEATLVRHEAHLKYRERMRQAALLSSLKEATESGTPESRIQSAPDVRTAATRKA